MKNVLKQTKGITLIALVITIIVLLILAGVSIATLTGENGILTQANNAKTDTQIAEEKEQIALAVSAETMNNSGEQITQSGLQSELDKLGANATVTEEGEGFRIKFNKSGREYVIDKNGNIVQIFDPNDKTPETEEIAEATEWTKLNKVSTLGGYNSSKGVNAPKLGSELTAITLTDDLSTYASNGTWYDYVAQTGTTDGKTSKWANAVTTDADGAVTGYYVWIPRYAYKITSGYHSSSTGTIEIKFLKGTTNEFADGTGTAETDPSKITYTNGVQDQWLVHPAFTASAENGGGFGEITGIWVAKYEISAFIDASETSTRVISSTTAEQQIKLRVLPGVQSSSIGNIGTMYTLAYNMNRNAESHMLKNSEWGAVAYLAHSKYGRNGTEVTINSTMYTSTATDASSWGTDTFTGGSNTETGYLSNGVQSTTGNAYGIYDMNGGKWEYVASYINNGASNLTNYGTDMTSGDIGTSTKYKTVYNSSTSDNGSTWSSSIQSANYDLAKGVKGDAVYETSSSYSNSNSWNSDYSNFPYAYGPFSSVVVAAAVALVQDCSISTATMATLTTACVSVPAWLSVSATLTPELCSLYSAQN